jgi:dihydrofolate synthase / folylpolyglutamate synthase
VIEVGLGGRLDSTNIISPEVSVITNISYDHMNILGNTLQEIASEKAGIIKPGIPVVIGERDEETFRVFTDKAEALQSPIRFASDEWEVYVAPGALKNADLLSVSVRSITDEPTDYELQLDLTGSYQQQNLRTVLSAIMVLRSEGWNITNAHIREGLRQVKARTGLMGRWQILGRRPLVIADTGHNEAGIAQVVRNIQETPHGDLHFVLGMVKDKEISKVLKLLPRNATYYFCAPALERAKPAAELMAEAQNFGLNGRVFESVRAALQAAREAAGPDDLILIGGSTFVVGEAD